MSTAPVTLGEYEAAERAMSHETATSGMIVHAVITVLVSVGLVVINATVAAGFPWSVFAVGGMLTGLLVHWWFGYVKLDEQLTRRQKMTEARAAGLR